MKKLLLASALLAASGLAQAEYKDVIGFTMSGECTFKEYMEIVGEFNKWAKPRGYSAQVFMPNASNDLDTFYWVGTSPDTATFGKAHDEWVAGVMAGDTAPADLQGRFDECQTQTSRQSFLAF